MKRDTQTPIEIADALFRTRMADERCYQLYDISSLEFSHVNAKQGIEPFKSKSERVSHGILAPVKINGLVEYIPWQVGPTDPPRDVIGGRHMYPSLEVLEFCDAHDLLLNDAVSLRTYNIVRSTKPHIFADGYYVPRSTTNESLDALSRLSSRLDLLICLYGLSGVAKGMITVSPSV